MQNLISGASRLNQQGLSAIPAIQSQMNKIPGSQAVQGTLQNPAAQDALGILAGLKSKTAPLENLNRAMLSDIRGEPTWPQGWERGAETKWRYEIPDTNAKWIWPRKLSNVPQVTTLGKVLNHPDLYAGYPSMKNMKVSIVSDPTTPYGASYNYATKEMALNAHPRSSPEDLKSTILHEVQHGVQGIEGFTRGAYLSDMPEDQIRRMHNIINSPDMRQQLKGMTDADKIDLLRVYNYLNKAGEIEAINVQNRLNMTPKQLRATPPSVSETNIVGEQVPRNIQIINEP